MTWETAVLVVLAAVTVVVAALGVIVAVAAIWGFKEISNKAGNRARISAEKAVEKKLTEYFADGNVLANLRALVDVKMTEAADQVYKDVSLPVGAADEIEDADESIKSL